MKRIFLIMMTLVCTLALSAQTLKSYKVYQRTSGKLLWQGTYVTVRFQYDKCDKQSHTIRLTDKKIANKISDMKIVLVPEVKKSAWYERFSIGDYVLTIKVYYTYNGKRHCKVERHAEHQ